MLFLKIQAWLRNHIPPPTENCSWCTQETWSFGEQVGDERDNLLAGGSWPTLDNSSRLNHHTWSASQPSAGTMGVWCIDPPHWTSPCPGLAWTLFRCLLHMLSSLNWCPIICHLMCLLPETKHVWYTVVQPGLNWWMKGNQEAEEWF